MDNEKFWKNILDTVRENPFSAIWALAIFLLGVVYVAGEESASAVVNSLMGVAAGISLGSAIAYKWWSRATNREEALEKREKELEERENRLTNSIEQREAKVGEQDGLFKETTQRNLELQRSLDQQNLEVQRLGREVVTLQTENQNLSAQIATAHQQKDQAHDHVGMVINTVESWEPDTSSGKEMRQSLKEYLVQAQRMLRGN